MGEGWTRSAGTDQPRRVQRFKTAVPEKPRQLMAAKIQTYSKPALPSSGYNLSFTAASLRPELARIVAEHYLAAGDWDLARQRILSSKALQCRSASSAIRLEREFRQRLGTLTQDQLILAAQATAEDRAAIAWLAVCKSIRFVTGIRDRVQRYLTQDYPAQLALASRLAAPAPPLPGKPGDNATPSAKPVRYTPARSLRPQCSLPYIATEADLDQWLAALREAAQAELEKGNRLSL